MRFIPLLLFSCLALALVVALLEPKPELAQTPKILPSLQLQSLGGESSFRTDGTISIINFFASWCGPCKVENAELSLLKPEKNVTMHGIAWNDSEENIRRFLDDHGNPFHQLWRDEDGEAAIALGVRGVPETFIVDKRGMIRYHLTGPITPQVREEIIVPLLHQLAAE